MRYERRVIARSRENAIRRRKRPSIKQYVYLYCNNADNTQNKYWDGELNYIWREVLRKPRYFECGAGKSRCSLQAFYYRVLLWQKTERQNIFCRKNVVEIIELPFWRVDMSLWWREILTYPRQTVGKSVKIGNRNVNDILICILSVRCT